MRVQHELYTYSVDDVEIERMSDIVMKDSSSDCSVEVACSPFKLLATIMIISFIRNCEALILAGWLAGLASFIIVMCSHTGHGIVLDRKLFVHIVTYSQCVN